MISKRKSQTVVPSHRLELPEGEHRDTLEAPCIKLIRASPRQNEPNTMEEIPPLNPPRSKFSKEVKGFAKQRRGTFSSQLHNRVISKEMGRTKIKNFQSVLSDLKKYYGRELRAQMTSGKGYTNHTAMFKYHLLYYAFANFELEEVNIQEQQHFKKTFGSDSFGFGEYIAIAFAVGSLLDPMLLMKSIDADKIMKESETCDESEEGEPVPSLDLSVVLSRFKENQKFRGFLVIGDAKKDSFFGHLDGKTDREKRHKIMKLSTEVKVFDSPTEVGCGQKKALASMIRKFCHEEKIRIKMKEKPEYRSAVDALCEI